MPDPQSLVSLSVSGYLESASWIRKMFEAGAALRAQVGADQVFDFSLGNPHLEPPVPVLDALAKHAADRSPGLHRYMPNPGLTSARAKVAAYVSTAERVVLPPENILLTCGAASGLNVVLKSLLNPGENVVVFAPYFPEYRFYARHAEGEIRVTPTTETFDLDLVAADKAINASTRAVLLNSPNNPTGRVYPESSIAGLVELLNRRNATREKPILLISDEPYRRLVFDGVTVPPLLPAYPATVIVGSFSKDLGLAGERIGYIALHPECPSASGLLAAFAFCLRTLGFVNAPALLQRAIADAIDATVDVDAYRRNRDRLWQGLTDIGYQCVKPEGAFYLFPKSPLADDRDFVTLLTQQHVLAVPGIGFGTAGYFRLSYAVEPDIIDRALPRFAAAFDQAKAVG